MSCMDAAPPMEVGCGYQILKTMDHKRWPFIQNQRYETDFHLFTTFFTYPAQHFGVERHGLKRSEMEDILKLAGFKDVRVFVSFEMEKGVETGSKQTFPFIVATGVRRG